jgi:hypothetical protein
MAAHHLQDETLEVTDSDVQDSATVTGQDTQSIFLVTNNDNDIHGSVQIQDMLAGVLTFRLLARTFGRVASIVQLSGFGGLGVSMLASGTQDRGFAPDRSRRIFPAGKIHSMPSFGREVK